MRLFLLGLLFGALSVGFIQACSNANGQTQNNTNSNDTCQCQNLTKQVENIQKQALTVKEFALDCSNPEEISQGNKGVALDGVVFDNVISASHWVQQNDLFKLVGSVQLYQKTDGRAMATCATNVKSQKIRVLMR